MEIKTTQQLHALEIAMNRCRHSAWLESVQGKRFDLEAEKKRSRKVHRLQSDPSVLVGNWIFYPDGLSFSPTGLSSATSQRTKNHFRNKTF